MSMSQHEYGWKLLRETVNTMAVMDGTLEGRLVIALQELSLVEEANLPVESWRAVQAIVKDGKGDFEATVHAMDDGQREDLAQKIFDCFLALAKTMNN
jgi:hypothetical protein